MKFGINVFIQNPLDQFDGKGLLKALKSANHTSLCQEYGLEAGLIPQALNHLALISLPGGAMSPFFMLKYQSKERQPIVVYAWDVFASPGKSHFQGVMESGISNALKKELERSQSMFIIELSRNQLEDPGILFAYEIARWILAQNRGVLQGLGGLWYQLNRFRAFIPFAGA